MIPQTGTGHNLKAYDQETLTHVQQCELMILRDFVSICNENGLSYFGIAGTGIGALRHGGFIPWDDDIDVGLLAADYEKLISIVRRDYSDKYEVINASINIEYPLPTTRIMLKGTQFCEESLSHLPLNLGIFLDVYSFDNVAADERSYRKQAWDAWFWSHVRILLSVSDPVIQIKGIRGNAVRLACKAASRAFNLIGLSKEKVYEKETEARKRYRDVDTGRVGYLCDTNRLTQTYSLDDVFPLRTIRYEGMDITFPNKLESMLEALYGDYMQLPPEDSRKNHYPARLSFGSY